MHTWERLSGVERPASSNRLAENYFRPKFLSSRRAAEVSVGWPHDFFPQPFIANLQTCVLRQRADVVHDPRVTPKNQHASICLQPAQISLRLFNHSDLDVISNRH